MMGGMRWPAPKTFKVFAWFFMLLAAAILVILWSPWPTYAAILVALSAFGMERLAKGRQNHASR
jgi:hypothetical protein